MTRGVPTGTRQRQAGLRLTLAARIIVHRPSEPEVEQLDGVRRQEHVGRLESRWTIPLP